jgi:hypothetical protein
LVVKDYGAYLHLIQMAFSERVTKTRWEIIVAKDGEALRLLFVDERSRSCHEQNALLTVHKGGRWTFAWTTPRRAVSRL